MSATEQAQEASPIEASESNIETSQEEINEGQDLSQEESAPQQKAASQKKEEAKSEQNIKTFNIKVNGKTKEIKLDLNNDKDLEKYISLAESSTEKFEEAAMTRKQVEKLVQELRNNPLAILKHKDLGIDVKNLAKQILEEEMEENKLSPEQKKLKEMEQKLKEYEEEKKRIEEEKEIATKAAMKAKAVQQFDEELDKALQGGDIPKSPYVVKRVADAMLEVLSVTDDNGNPMYPDATVSQIWPIVKEQITSELKAMFEVAPDEVVEGLLGNKLNTMRKNRISKAKATPPKIEDTGKAVKKTEESSEEEKIPFNKFFSPF